MFEPTYKVSDEAIKNILSLNRITYVGDGVIRVKGSGELYYLKITSNGIYTGYMKESK